METIFWIILATIANSAVALVGAFSLALSPKSLNRILFALVGFSAGALLSGAFFHLLAESLEKMETQTAFILVFVGFILFFLIERFLHWHHCHEGKCDVHSFSYLILIGDGLHNFIDGLVIAASFLVNTGFGFVTTIMVIGHELPQELGDFGVLVYGGFSKKKALFFNLLSQMTSILGGIIGFFIAASSELGLLLLPFAAGGFIYIAASDLVPELHKQENTKKMSFSFIFFIIGVIFMLATKILLGGV